MSKLLALIVTQPQPIPCTPSPCISCLRVKPGSVKWAGNSVKQRLKACSSNAPNYNPVVQVQLLVKVHTVMSLLLSQHLWCTLQNMSHSTYWNHCTHYKKPMNHFTRKGLTSSTDTCRYHKTVTIPDESGHSQRKNKNQQHLPKTSSFVLPVPLVNDQTENYETEWWMTKLKIMKQSGLKRRLVLAEAILLMYNQEAPKKHLVTKKE